jgi:poly-gamma-glutamate capsule biosynthesis protein CapA/YwtB (metallophosphatase superfamily)
MTPARLSYVRRAAAALRAVGATLIAGHSAHVFHGVEPGVLYDLGDFLDDYAVDARLRNDLGLLFLVTLDRNGPVRLEAVPLKLESGSDDTSGPRPRRGRRPGTPSWSFRTSPKERLAPSSDLS